MYLMIIGTALAGLGVIAAATSSRDRMVRFAAAGVGGFGVVLVLVSWMARNPPTNAVHRIRSECQSAANKLESFETRRTANPPYWTNQGAETYWDSMDDLLNPIVKICIENPTTCDRPRLLDPRSETFSADLAELIDALRTGKPCRR